MASNWSGVFNVVEEAKRHTDTFVTMRCVDNRRKEEKTFFTAKFSGKPGEWVEKCRLGEPIFLSGQPALEEYKGKQYLNLWVSDVQFVPNGKTKKEKVEKVVSETVSESAGSFEEENLGEDIPF